MSVPVLPYNEWAAKRGIMDHAIASAAAGYELAQADNVLPFMQAGTLERQAAAPSDTAKSSDNDRPVVSLCE